ncbi:serine/threonine-protein phosphatase [Leptospira langatensis]|uniref:Serine/threonine-protein phosphatase n=1 Tax=Leptospira langatensis TaxID=2484983 RepID=A0A5F1ZQH4_9LEPT|nr:PP2C family protein-serine/threonine phosphatase [Leptospira langatensis]TGK05397.1 serine/threonine-protein phosphatase [Leptospira langatensis]TGL38533.1 serine/threonine-protein phosphatase [Leptospira langatensis]
MTQRYFYRLFEAIHRRISYTFSIVSFSLTGAWFGAAYAFFFGSATIPMFSLQSHYPVVLIFLAATVFVTLIHGTQYGLLAPVGLPGLEGHIQRVNRALHPNFSLRHAPSQDLDTVLSDLIRLPTHNMISSFGYASFVLLADAIAYLFLGYDLKELWYIFLGWLAAVFVYCGFAYIITDYITGPKRVLLKKILLSRAYNVNTQPGFLGLKGKFGFLLSLVLLSLTVLAVYVSLGPKSSLEIVAFIGLTFFAATILIILYFQSISTTLEQISKSANDLAAGGPGKLPLISIDKEFLGFARDFAKATGEIGRIREHLQFLVEEKTSELRETLRTVEELKSQQDGDYFLTSLLIKPLGINRTSGKKVKVDFLIRQKKNFVFKGKESEIGGDICIAQEILLRGKEYTVFLNADAMGKSLQGAGGILVLGAAFHSILQRTLTNESTYSLYAEKWIKNAFTELHKLFQGFDGSMLVSMVLGVLDEQAGLLYYINAEHPWSVLYRDGKASFLEETLQYRKLGTPGIEDSLTVKTFLLEPDDVLIVGSDGRDDLELQVENGERIINEDESLFLRAVESSEGDLQSILTKLEAKGKITDDLSLLRIGYDPGKEFKRSKVSKDVQNLSAKAKGFLKNKELTNAIRVIEEALGLSPENQVLKRDLIRLHYRNNDHQKACRYLETYVEENPGDTDMIYIASFCFKKIGNFTKSLELAERVQLRNPGIPANLVHIADLNFKLGRPEKAAHYARLGLELEPENQKASEIVKRIAEAN